MLKISIRLLLLILVSTKSVAVPLINGTVSIPGIFPIQPITGEIDIAARYMHVDSWNFFFTPMITNSIEILEPGQHLVLQDEAYLPPSMRRTMTLDVPEAHIGAYMEVSWNGSIFNVIMVWRVDDVGRYHIIDSDGDGFPGHALFNGPFVGAGITAYYEFTAEPLGPPKPGVYLTVNTVGGDVQECTSNSHADVTLNAISTLTGGAELDSITWSVDGVFTGTGTPVTESLSLGDHVIEVTALTTTGESDTISTTVTVKDSTRPVVTVAVVDENGVELASAREGEYDIKITVTDACDMSPVITSSTATPTTVISDGSMLKLDPEKGIRLPVTAVRLTVTAKDASGNFSYTTAQSSKTFVLQQ